jgi:hypothetical protein
MPSFIRTPATERTIEMARKAPGPPSTPQQDRAYAISHIATYGVLVLYVLRDILELFHPLRRSSSHLDRHDALSV